MNIKRKKILLGLTACAFAAVLTGCAISYSFSGASIPEAAQTVSVAYFPNNAVMVAPILSPTLTEALQDRFSRQTRLSLEREDGDLVFEGEITGYTTAPSSISADEYAQQNRLTVTVKVRFANRFRPEDNFDRSFTAFQDYNSSEVLASVEGQLIPEIVEMLVDDIFNAAVTNW